jgi:hypothetical protein
MRYEDIIYHIEVDPEERSVTTRERVGWLSERIEELNLEEPFLSDLYTHHRG